MTTSRTGTTTYLRNSALVKRRAKTQGLTHCPLCAVELDYINPRQPNSAETDHIIPVAHGGTDDIDNLTVICLDCNRRKGPGQNPTPHAAADDFPTSRTW